MKLVSSPNRLADLAYSLDGLCQHHGQFLAGENIAGVLRVKAEQLSPAIERFDDVSDGIARLIADAERACISLDSIYIAMELATRRLEQRLTDGGEA